MGVSIPLTMRIQMTNGQTYKACTLTTFIYKCPVNHLPFVLFLNICVYRSDQCLRYMHYTKGVLFFHFLKQKVVVGITRHVYIYTRKIKIKQFGDCGNSGVDMLYMLVCTLTIRLRKKKVFLVEWDLEISFKGKTESCELL